MSEETLKKILLLKEKQNNPLDFSSTSPLLLLTLTSAGKHIILNYCLLSFEHDYDFLEMVSVVFMFPFSIGCYYFFKSKI